METIQQSQTDYNWAELALRAGEMILPDWAGNDENKAKQCARTLSLLVDEEFRATFITTALTMYRVEVGFKPF